MSVHWCYACGQPATLCMNGAWWDARCANRRYGADRLTAVSTLLRRVSRRSSPLLRGSGDVMGSGGKKSVGSVDTPQPIDPSSSPDPAFWEVV